MPGLDPAVLVPDLRRRVLRGWCLRWARMGHGRAAADDGPVAAPDPALAGDYGLQGFVRR